MLRNFGVEKSSVCTAVQSGNFRLDAKIYVDTSGNKRHVTLVSFQSSNVRRVSIEFLTFSKMISSRRPANFRNNNEGTNYLV
jgi:hypothetical protein